jgi:hypothetical protein
LQTFFKEFLDSTGNLDSVLRLRIVADGGWGPLAFAQSPQQADQKSFVRRQGFWHQWGLKLREFGSSG